MTVAERENAYKKLANLNKENSRQLKKKLSFNSLLRILVFLLGSLAVYLLYGSTLLTVTVVICTALLFLLLLRRHETLSEKSNHAEAAQKIAEAELKAFRHDFSSFNGMDERINPAHDFSFDLDIFGNNSICQLLNRTALKIGGEKLADMLEHPLTDKKDIKLRQQAVYELSQKEDFCLNFRIIGNLSDDVFSNPDDVQKSLSNNHKLKNRIFWTAMTFIVPAIYFIYFILLAVGLAPLYLLLPLYLVTLALSSVPMKKVKEIWHSFDKKSKTLSAYSKLLEQVENTRFESEVLIKLQQTIVTGKPASAHIRKLASHIRNLDMAFAAPVLLILNPLLLWNVLYALKTTKWLNQNAEKTMVWFATLAETDALISLATFTSNKPHYIFPEISDTVYFQGKQLGHPLIADEKCVKNDIEILSKPFFMIVTGANMAGKSTYLRTIGVNHFLASIGVPVCAESMTFFPGRLLTNLRTSDSLVNNESYFFAELKRLKMIIDNLKSGEEGIFIILDEILKGTNSQDKQKGSFALMKRLINLGANGIIATHDLALGELEKEFPHEIKNFHFDAHIQENTLSFDYTLRRGIAQNMNATFLMRNMGIINLSFE